MKRTHHISALTLIAAVVLAAHPVVSTAEPAARKAAIFVVNHADKSFDEKRGAFEDYLTGSITEKGYSLVSHEIVNNAWSSFQRENPKTSLDEALENQSSALRLAQMLNVNYVLLGTISSFGKTYHKDTIGGKEVSSTKCTLRASYRLIDGVHGGTVASSNIVAEDTIWETTGPDTTDTDLVDRLLTDAATKISVSLGEKTIQPASVALAPAEFTVVCGIADAGGQQASVPDIRVNDDHTIVRDETRVLVQGVAVTVELDGAAIGSTPDKFSAPPGLHKIRLTHEQCKPWERTINIAPGQKLRETLVMTDDAYQRWKDQTAFLQTLENGRKLTDAEVERIRGLAKFLGNSRYVMDIQVQGKANQVNLEPRTSIYSIERITKLFAR